MSVPCFVSILLSRDNLDLSIILLWSVATPGEVGDDTLEEFEGIWLLLLLPFHLWLSE